MFDNIGGKIKGLAVVICWLGIIASVIGGIIIISMDDDLAVSGVMTMVFGSLISWIGSFFAYGFGQLIENTDDLVDRLNISVISRSTSVSGSNNSDAISTLDEWLHAGLITPEEYQNKKRNMQ